jgi:hypothetical protein
MTSQTRKFIEIADIIGLRFDCKAKECGASLTLATFEAINRNSPLKECPNCGKQWALLTEADYQHEFKTLVDCLRKIAAAPMGCVFTLEIKPEIQEAPSLSKRGQ